MEIGGTDHHPVLDCRVNSLVLLAVTKRVYLLQKYLLLLKQ